MNARFGVLLYKKSRFYHEALVGQNVDTDRTGKQHSLLKALLPMVVNTGCTAFNLGIQRYYTKACSLLIIMKYNGMNYALVPLRWISE